MFDWTIYRVFEYFMKKDESMAVGNTTNFMVLFQASFLVPLFLVFSTLSKFDPQMLGLASGVKYYVGIPLAIILIAVNSYFIKRKLNNDSISLLRTKYHKSKYAIPIWMIFSFPFLMVFVGPLIYGAMNGTLSFPFLER